MASNGHRVPDQVACASLEERSAARRATRCRLKVLHAAFQLVQTLVGLLRGLIGGFGTLGRALHARIELVETGVDSCELVVIGRAGRKAGGCQDRHAERARHHLMLLGQEHSDCPYGWGRSEYSGLFAEAMTRLQPEFSYVHGP